MFGREARNKISQILEKKAIPLVVGGSGFYIKALIDGLSKIDISDDQTIRDDLRQRLKNEGVEVLHRELESVDPDLAKKAKIKDKQRILRGLEVFYLTGIPLSQFQQNKPDPADFNPVLIGIDAEREFLYNKINSRVDEMIKIGLVEEVRQLKNRGFSDKNNALNTVGYKEVFDYLNNMIEFEEMVEKIKLNSRRYAKRQLTWFRRDERIKWLKIDDFNNIEDAADKILERYRKLKLTQ
jgi:tRNA dimethylallyltransferase